MAVYLAAKKVASMVVLTADTRVELMVGKKVAKMVAWRAVN